MFELVDNSPQHAVIKVIGVGGGGGNGDGGGGTGSGGVYMAPLRRKAGGGPLMGLRVDTEGGFWLQGAATAAERRGMNAIMMLDEHEARSHSRPKCAASYRAAACPSATNGAMWSSASPPRVT